MKEAKMHDNKTMRFAMLFWGVCVFLGVSFMSVLPRSSDANVENLRNCFSPSHTRVCQQEGISAPALYPDPVKVRGASRVTHQIHGCYSLEFKRVSDVPGGPINGKCEERSAPFRFYLSYKTICPEGASSCVFGSQVLVFPNLFVDGPTPFGEGFRPAISGDLPIPLTAGIAGTDARETCEVMNRAVPECKGDNMTDESVCPYVYDPVLQSCKKTPKRYCEEMGFTWSALDTTCISQPNTLCADVSVCTGAENICEGHTFRPDGQSCFCMGSASPTTSGNRDSGGRGACGWVHTEDVANPFCDPEFDPALYHWVAMDDWRLDVCCEDGDAACGDKNKNACKAVRDFVMTAPASGIVLPPGILQKANAGACSI